MRTTQVAILTGVLLFLGALVVWPGALRGGRASPTAAQDVDPLAVAQESNEALNRGDLDGVMETFADDAVVAGLFECVSETGGIFGECVGRDAVRNLYDFHINQNHLNITIIDAEVSGNTVTSTFEIRSEDVRGAGLERLVASSTTEVDDGKIVELRGGPPPVPDDQSNAFVAFVFTEGIGFDLGPGRDADQTPGAAFIFPLNDRTQVEIGVVADPEGVRQPIHIHEGSCGDLGAVRYPLQDVAGGRSITIVDVSQDELRSGNFAINVHQSTDEVDTYVACGDIPALDVAEEAMPTDQPAPTEAPLPVKPPDVGTGDLSAREGTVSAWWYALVAGGAALVAVLVGRALTHRRW